MQIERKISKEEIISLEQPCKIGDYLYIIDATKDGEKNNYKIYNNTLIKVRSIIKEEDNPVGGWWITFTPANFGGGGCRIDGNGWKWNKHIRLATKDEIEANNSTKEKFETISNYNEFAIGSRVIITNCGQNYSSCDTLFKFLKFNNNYNCHSCLNGDKGVITNLVIHPGDKSIMAAIKLDKGKEVVVNTNGIKVINEWKIPKLEDLSLHIPENKNNYFSLEDRYLLLSDFSIFNKKPKYKSKLKLKTNKKIKITKKNVKISNKHLI